MPKTFMMVGFVVLLATAAGRGDDVTPLKRNPAVVSDTQAPPQLVAPLPEAPAGAGSDSQSAPVPKSNSFQAPNPARVASPPPSKPLQEPMLNSNETPQDSAPGAMSGHDNYRTWILGPYWAIQACGREPLGSTFTRLPCVRPLPECNDSALTDNGEQRTDSSRCCGSALLSWLLCTNTRSAPAGQSLQSPLAISIERVFRFDRPAHFALPRFQEDGLPANSEGLVIYEGMTLSFHPLTGKYEVRFVVSTPDMPVTLRLQLTLLDAASKTTTTLTLPPIDIMPARSMASARTAGMRRNWQLDVSEVRQEGQSAWLTETRQVVGVARNGMARFGSLPDAN